MSYTYLFPRDILPDLRRFATAQNVKLKHFACPKFHCGRVNETVYDGSVGYIVLEDVGAKGFKLHDQTTMIMDLPRMKARNDEKLNSVRVWNLDFIRIYLSFHFRHPCFLWLNSTLCPSLMIFWRRKLLKKSSGVSSHQKTSFGSRFVS